MSGKTKSGFGKYAVCILFALILAATVSSFGVVFARYAKQHESAEGVVTSQNMYFRSDYLSEQGEAYTISSDSVTFRLMNYPDALRVSEIDVKYTITVTGGAYTLSKSNNDDNNVLSASGKNYVDITLSGLERGKTYTVTAVGTNGYKTTLSATFTVKAEEKQVFKSVEQTDYYVLLTVWTQSVTGTATISVPEDLIPDNTDPILRNVTTETENFTDAQSFTQGYSSRTYRFFLKNGDTTSYTAESFTVTIDGVAAVEKTN